MPTIEISEIELDFKLHLTPLNTASNTVKKAQSIVKKYGGAVPQIPLDPEKLLARAKRVMSGTTYTQLTEKEMRSLAYLSLSLNENDKFFSDFLELVKASNSRRVLSALFASYIMYFDRENQNVIKTANLLKKNKKLLPKHWLRRLEYADLLSSKTIEKVLAKNIFNQYSDEFVFERAGLIGAFSGSRLVKNTLISLAELVEEKINKGNSEVIYDFLKIICPDGTIKPQAGVAAMIASLRPFLENAPSPHLKGLLQDIFIKSFSDPRVSTSQWPEIPLNLGGNSLRVACIGVIKRWLNFEAIELFFKVIAEHAPNEQFEPRKNLWKSYFDQDFVGDAHIILGQNAERTASRLKSTDEAAKGLFFGKLSGANPDQSVLLMQIGKLTIAEWSHNGKFRAWSSDATRKPKFYKNFYSANELRIGSNKIKNVNGSYGDGIVHLGNWVDRAKRYVNQETGIRIARRIR